MEEENNNSISNSKSDSRNYVLPVSILVAAVLISGSVIYAVGILNSGGGRLNKANPDSGTAPANQASVKEISSRDVILGDPKAPVTLIEYGDYQCPFCAKFFNESEKLIRENYIKTGKVKMVFRNFIVNDRTPLDHESHLSAEAAECAKDQNSFWAFHDALFTAESKDGKENNGNLNRDLFVGIARSLRMDTDRFSSCFDNHTHASDVQAGSDGAVALGITATPTIFINGGKVEGAYPFSYFKQVIDGLLKTE